MQRLVSMLPAGLLLTAAAHAQCAQGSPVGLVQWSSTSSYTSTWALADEGISNPPIALTAIPNFPMPGAIGNLDTLWVNTNGEVYLTDSTLALTEPAGGALYGANSLLELQGPVGGSARVVALGSDDSASAVSGANWSINVDQSTPGQVTITWVDMARLGYTTTDRFSFACTLYGSGTIQFDYGPTFTAGMPGWIGVSVGNAEPSTAGSTVLSTLPTSPATEGILYENVANFSAYAGQSILIAPDFTPGVENYTVAAVIPYTAPTCASNTNYGTGCHTYAGLDNSSHVELFAGTPAAKAALDGNAELYTITGNGYTATWLPGVAGTLYVPPTGSANALALTDDSVASFTPVGATTVPGGSVTTWTVSSNGVLTAGATGNQGTSYTASLAAVATAPDLGWYMWRDYNPSGASGQVKWEEVGTMLYVTYDGVYEYGTTNPATFQWQINETTGDVLLVWVSMAISTNTTNMLVGCSLAGTGATPPSSTLSAGSFVMAPQVTLSPVTLNASPRPVINPSTIVTYTASNLPEFAPSSGLYLSTMFLSVNQLPGGFDLAGILTTVPGCNAYIATLDLDLGAQLTFAPTASWNVNYNNVNFAPGNLISAQAVALFDGSTPLANGEAGGFLLSNGVLSAVAPF